MRTCSLCDRPVEAKGLCKTHYRDARKRIVAEEKRQQRAAMTGDDDDDEPRRGRGYTTDQLGSIPLPRPMTDEERYWMARQMTRCDTFDLAPMLGVAE